MKNLFSIALLRTREKMGYQSALKFHAFLKTSGGTDLNYAQYKKIESGLIRARPEFASRLAKSLPVHGEALVRAYCSELFPDFLEIFEAQTNKASPTPKMDRPLLYAQNELTPRQIATIVTSATHYELYLILALARSPVTFEELKASLPDLSVKNLKEFESVKLLYRNDEKKYASASSEWSFPDATNETLKAAYLKMSHWDLHFQDKHRFSNVYTRVLLRRVSLRYLPLLKRQAEFLADLLRAADEVDSAKNMKVVSLVLQLREGKLPG